MELDWQAHGVTSNSVAENYRTTVLHVHVLTMDLFHYLPPPAAKGGGQSETLLNTCIAHSNSADLLLFNNASDWLSGDLDNESQ